MVGTLFMTRLFVSKLSSGIMLISAIIESWKPDGGSGMVRIDQSVKVKLLLSEVGGSGTISKSKSSKFDEFSVKLFSVIGVAESSTRL